MNPFWTGMLFMLLGVPGFFLGRMLFRYVSGELKKLEGEQVPFNLDGIFSGLRDWVAQAENEASDDRTRQRAKARKAFAIIFGIIGTLAGLALIFLVSWGVFALVAAFFKHGAFTWGTLGGMLTGLAVFGAQRLNRFIIVSTISLKRFNRLGDGEITAWSWMTTGFLTLGIGLMASGGGIGIFLGVLITAITVIVSPFSPGEVAEALDEF